MERTEAVEVIRKNWPDASFTQLREALETLIPELRESEDERNWKAVLDCVKDEALRGWLEKQKTSEEAIRYVKENHSPDEVSDFQAAMNIAVAKAYDKGVQDTLEKQKEQPKEELVYRLNGLMQDYIKAGKDEEEKEHRFKCYQLFWDALEDANFFEGKEQKPSTPEDIAAAYQMGLAKGRNEQNPAEWSEEDDMMLANVFGTYKTLEDMLDLSTSQDRDILDSMDFEREWLKKRFKSLRPQPKEEYNPAIIVDESCFKTHVNCVNAYYELRDYLVGLFRQYVECETPVTKENIDADLAMMYPYMEKYVASVIGNCSPLDDHALRSFYSLGYKEGKEEHWKPSEEQMEILGRFNDPVLKSLYSDLQKLL